MIYNVGYQCNKIYLWYVRFNFIVVIILICIFIVMVIYVCIYLIDFKFEKYERKFQCCSNYLQYFMYCQELESFYIIYNYLELNFESYYIFYVYYFN